jgi:UDP-N-acetylglucosamine:LPS N-acetylglucosamine transferase
MNIKSSIRKIKKRFVGGFGPMLSGLSVLASKSPGDKSEATAQNATMHTQAKLSPERASMLPSR